MSGKMKKKIVALVMALVMAISLLPGVAWAGETEVNQFVSTYFVFDQDLTITDIIGLSDESIQETMQADWLQLSLADRQAAVDRYSDLYQRLRYFGADLTGINDPQGGGGNPSGDVPIGNVAFSTAMTAFADQYIVTDVDQVVGVRCNGETVSVSMLPFWLAQSEENDLAMKAVSEAWNDSFKNWGGRNSANNYMNSNGFSGFSNLMEDIRYHYIWSSCDMERSNLTESDFDCTAMWDMLVSLCDGNKDGVLSAEERKTVTKITLSDDTSAKTVTDLMYLWYFPNLKTLDVSSCTNLWSINLNRCGKLKKLDITGCTSLYAVGLDGHDIVNSGKINSLEVVGDTGSCAWWNGAGDTQSGADVSEEEYLKVSDNDNFRYWIPQSLLDSGIVTVKYETTDDVNATFTVTLHQKENAAQVWDALYKEGWLKNGTLPFRVAYTKPAEAVCGGARIENGPPVGAPEATSVARWFVADPMMGSVAITAQGISVSAGEKAEDRWYHGEWKTVGEQEISRVVSLHLALDGMTGYQVKFKNANLRGVTAGQIDLTPLDQDAMKDFTVVFNEADNCLSCMPKATSDISQIFFPANASLIGIKAPEDGYLAYSWEYTDDTGHRDGSTMGINGKKPVMQIMPSVVIDRAYNEMPYLRDYTITWSKDGAEKIVQMFTLRFLGQRIKFSEDCDWTAIGADSGDWNMEALQSDVADSGIRVDFNGDNGYYHVSFGEKIPSVEDLTAKLRIKAPEGAVSYAMVGRSGENGVGTLDVAAISGELQNSQKTNVPADGYLEFPLVQYETMTVEHRTIYYPGAQNEWVQILQWYDVSGQAIGTPQYIGGQCDAFDFSTTTTCYVGDQDIYVNENKFKSNYPTDSGHGFPVSDPVMIGGSGELAGCTLRCEMFPQENGKGYYFRLQLEGGNNNGKKIVYLPYSFMGADMTYEKAKTLVAPKIHHFNDAHQQTEEITGQYTQYGIRFEVNSFSPFTLNWTESTQPAPTPGHHSDPAKPVSAPLTNDPGIAIYGVMNVMSLMGLGYLGTKKKH